MIEVTLNGQARPIAEQSSVSALLAALALDARKIAVERNREIVPRSLYDATRLLPGDRIEIVHFIGGG